MKYRPKRLRRLDRVWLNNGQPMYFVTIRVAGRGNTLANEVVHKRLREFLHATASHHDWWASRYVLMPDHLHLLARPGIGATTLGTWIKALKTGVADREFKWQTGFFDHVLRSDESQSEKWEYIRRNPVRAGLAADAEAWPFGGEIDWAQGGVAAERDIGPVSRPGAGAAINNKSTDPSTDPIHHHAEAKGEERGGRVPGDANTQPRRETRPTTDAVADVACRSFELIHHDASGDTEPRLDNVAAEEPLEIRIEGHSVAVVMRTPGHDRELAAGFLLTENLIRKPADIFDITQCGSSAADQVINVTLRDPGSFDPARLTRNVFSSSSCGVCSKATIEAVRQSFAAIENDCVISSATLLKLPNRLRRKQETFERTGGLHACALFDLDGELLGLREDVGRHNALDKLIGRSLLKDQLPLRDCVLFLSGRVSFEMMQKALAAGIPIVAAISAPTSLAVEFARESNQTLVGFVRGATLNVYAGAQRVVTSM